MDYNHALLDALLHKYPKTISLEMETGHLLDLSRISVGSSIQSSACTIVLAQRKSGAFLDNSTIHFLEKQCGLAVLNTLARTKLEKEMNDDQCVWNK